MPASLKTTLTPAQIAKLSDERIFGPLLAEAAARAHRRRQEAERRSGSARLFQAYQDDPVGFGRDVLHEDFTPDVMRVMESVRDNPVTIARSANATGKCLAHGERVRLAGGEWVRAEELIGRTFTVLSVREHLDLTLGRRTNTARASDNGLRPVVRVRFASGLEIVRTENHPLAVLTRDGSLRWQAAGSLRFADVVLGVQGDYYVWDEVVAVVPLGEQPTVAIEVERDHTFLTDFVEHNTHCAARIAVWFYKVFPGAQVYTTAAPPEDNLRRLLWGEISRIQDHRQDLFADDKQLTLRIARSGSEFITGVAIPMNDTPEKREARFSGKHAPYLLFIVDEGDAVPDEIYRAIEGCMSGGHARMLIMFNPRHESGSVFRMERDRQANVVELSAFTHPNVVEGRELYPGAVTRDTTVRRINEMTRPLASGEMPDARSFAVPPFLVGAAAPRKDGQTYPPLPAGWRKIEDPAFSYMTLGRYPALGLRQLISQEWIDAARSRWDAYVARFGEKPPLGVMGKLGVDVADDGMDNSAACWRYGGWVPRPMIWNGVDVIATGERVIELAAHAANVSAILIDANGVGAGVPPYIRRKFVKTVKVVGVKVAEKATEKAQATSGDVLGEFAQLRDQLWWAAREWLRTDPGAMLPPDENLLEELRVVTYDTDTKQRIKIMGKDEMRKKLNRSPDRADALCLTFAPTDRKFRLEFV